MTKKEKELFFLLCRFWNADKRRLEKLLEKGAATPDVLGQLFFNRMQGIAYGVLKENDCLGKVNREFRNSLASAYERNAEKNFSFFLCVKKLSEILREQEGKYAMLKGALLCGTYPAGYRTSNDIDLLVHPEHVTDIGNALLAAGFRQGHLRNNLFIPATRKEIIESKMMRGETVPYVLEVNLPEMQFLEVDLNFSLDYKNGNPSMVKELIARTRKVSIDGINIMTLGKGDFFIHLCNHLYKEATTYPWVKMKRDMTLYKYCDIYFLLNRLSEKDTEILLSRMKEIEMQDLCSCVILWTHALFGVTNQRALDFAMDTLAENPDLLHRVTDPSKRKDFLYEVKDVQERFFHKNREKILQEVS